VRTAARITVAANLSIVRLLIASAETAIVGSKGKSPKAVEIWSSLTNGPQMLVCAAAANVEGSGVPFIVLEGFKLQ